jgi:hypothetical protein
MLIMLAWEYPNIFVNKPLSVYWISGINPNFPKLLLMVGNTWIYCIHVPIPKKMLENIIIAIPEIAVVTAPCQLRLFKTIIPGIGRV